MLAVAAAVVALATTATAQRREGPPLARDAGATRVETAVAVSRLAYPGFPICETPGPGVDPDVQIPCPEGAPSAGTAVLVRADDYADALVAAPLAEHRYGPILLTHPDRLHPATADELRRLVVDAGLGQVVLLGGTRALPPHVEQQVRELGIGDVRRVAGADRFHTAAELARAMVLADPSGPLPDTPIVSPLDTDTVLVARGSSSDAAQGWPDALSAASLATWLQTPLLLVERDALPASTAQALADLDARRVVIVGGSAAVSPQVEAELAGRVEQVTRIGGGTRYDTSRLVADRVIEDFATTGGLARAHVVDGRDWPDALTATVDGTLVMVDGQDLDGSPPTRDWLDQHAAEFDAVRLVGGPDAITQDVEEALRAVLRP